MRVVDGGEFLEVQAGFAANTVTGFARLNGRPVGIVANQTKVLAGVLDLDASDKIARFVRFVIVLIYRSLHLLMYPVTCRG